MDWFWNWGVFCLPQRREPVHVFRPRSLIRHLACLKPSYRLVRCPRQGPEV